VKRLRIELLGGFRLTSQGRPLTASLTARQQGLVAHLLLHRGVPLSRQRVAAALWPESTDAQALTNLRRELHHVRHVLPDAEKVLDSEGRQVAWRADGPFALDVAEFEAAASEGLRGERDALARAARLYQGPLLPDCHDEWIAPERERLEHQAIEVLARLVAVLEQDRAFGEAIEHAQSLLRLDALDERAWRALMRCHARLGHRAQALHAYQSCASVLERELDVQPGADTQAVYRTLVEGSDEVPAPPAPERSAVYPLVGRDAELAALVDLWQRVSAGEARVALVRGEAGIGKTRLAEELSEWCGARGVPVLSTRCYAAEGRLAFGPVAAWLQHEAIRPALAALDGVWLAEVARLEPGVLVGRPELAAPAAQLESWQRRRFFEALARAFSAALPALLVLDDLQWCDGDTLEWLHFLLRFAPRGGCLLVGTVRAEEESDNAALAVFLRELKKLDRLTAITLGPLDEDATIRLAEAVTDRPLDDTARSRVVRQTEGHPLFIVETARMGLAEGAASEPAVVPPRVQAVVARRLAQLSPGSVAAAELAAVVGRDFSFDLLAAAGDVEEDGLVRALDELWRRQIVEELAHDRWDFTHDRLREGAYAQIGPARRRLLHRRVAQALELVSASNLDPVSGEIAAHLDRAGQPARAAHFFRRAADVAMGISAAEEAIRSLEAARRALGRLPPSRDRDREELALRRALCEPLTTARGYAAPEVEGELEGVIALAQPLGDVDAHVQALWGLWAVHFVRGNLLRGRDFAREAVERAADDPVRAGEAHHALAGSLASLGDLEGARHEFQRALEACAPQPHATMLGSDLGVFIRAWHSQVLCLVGDLDEAGREAERAIERARSLEKPYSLALANAYVGITHQMAGEVERTRACAEEAIALCERYGFAYYGEWARILLGWACAEEGRPLDGIDLISSGIERLHAQGALVRRPYHLGLLAEAHLAAGQPDRASAVLDAGLAMASVHHDEWWSAELHRLRGERALGSDGEGHLVAALEIARAQGSRLLEGRAASSLAGRRTEVRTLSERQPG
jgi:DNA-binding SARP family transcriptional activator